MLIAADPRAHQAAGARLFRGRRCWRSTRRSRRPAHTAAADGTLELRYQYFFIFGRGTLELTYLYFFIFGRGTLELTYQYFFIFGRGTLELKYPYFFVPGWSQNICSPSRARSLF